MFNNTASSGILWRQQIKLSRWKRRGSPIRLCRADVPLICIIFDLNAEVKPGRTIMLPRGAQRPSLARAPSELLQVQDFLILHAVSPKPYGHMQPGRIPSPSGILLPWIKKPCTTRITDRIITGWQSKFRPLAFSFSCIV